MIYANINHLPFADDLLCSYQWHWLLPLLCLALWIAAALAFCCFQQRRRAAVDKQVAAAKAALAAEVAERRRAEEALRESELKFRTLFDEAADAIFLHDKQGRFLDANHRACESLGYSHEELLSKSVMDVDPEAVSLNLIKRFWEGDPAEEPLCIESDHVRKDGSKFDVEIRLGAVDLPQGRQIMAVARDVSQRKAAEAEREQLITKLESQNAELERFAYTVSHDLKSPLITIKGFLGMLRDDVYQAKTEAVEQDVARIAGAADKMGMLLDDLLQLSRVGRMVHPSQHIPLGELVEEAIDLNAGRIEGIGAQIEIAPHLPVVYGDRVRLLEVLQNLIDNALKYMGSQQRPFLQIGSRASGEHTVFYVRDNGMGIDGGDLEKIFELFEQLDPKAEGTGIGLALARRILEMHGGRIWAESQGRGCGSTFCFTLPAKSDAAASDAIHTGFVGDDTPEMGMG